MTLFLRSTPSRVALVRLVEQSFSSGAGVLDGKYLFSHRRFASIHRRSPVGWGPSRGHSCCRGLPHLSQRDKGTAFLGIRGWDRQWLAGQPHFPGL
jgi:hypothetical protein